MRSLFSRLFGKQTEVDDGRSSTPSGRAQQSSRDTKEEAKQAERAVRIAIYDSLGTIPRIVDIRSGDYGELLNEVSSKTYSFAHDKGGSLPYIAIKETVENLLHADIHEAVITILPDGNTIRVSDQGPGIDDKDRAFLPGFTTATSRMKGIIRGVGSGLPIVKDSMLSVGGRIIVEDNLKKGCVITLSCSMESMKSQSPPEEQTGARTAVSLQRNSIQRIPTTMQDKPETQRKLDSVHERKADEGVPVEKLDRILSERQQRVFMILAEEGEGGPSLVAKELEISLSTAYRDLVALEEHGLIQTVDNSGKRKLTSKGIAFLPYVAG